MDTHMTQVPLVIMTSPVTEWTLPGFFHQLYTYSHSYGYHPEEWVTPMVCGYQETDLSLIPQSCIRDFYNIGNFRDYPMNRWSDSLIVVLNMLKKRDIHSSLLLLDDYWIVRGIDVRAVDMLHAYHTVMHESIIKIDLAFDRLNSDHGRYYNYSGHIGTVGHIDLIDSNLEMQYSMSLWGGLYSTELMLDLVQPGWTAQEIELEGTPIVRTKPYVVVGTRQGPVLHTNVCHAGQFFNFGGPALSEEDMAQLRELNMTNGM